MNFFESRFWRAMGRLGDVFLVNLLWLIACLPVVTVGAATAAMHHVWFRILTHQEEPLFRCFWSGFTSNLKQAIAGWAIYLMVLFDAMLVLWTGYRMDLLATWMESRPLLVLGALLAVLVLFTAHYIFAIIAYFDCSLQQSFLNALGLSFRHSGWTLLLVLVSAGTVLLVYIAPFLTLIAFGLAGLLDSWVLFRLFRRYAPEAAE